MGGLRLRYPVHGPDRVLVVPRPVTHVFHDADDFILGRVLDFVRPEMLAERVLVFEESPGEGFIDHGYGANVSSSEFVNFLTSVVFCGRKAPKSICQQASAGSFGYAQDDGFLEGTKQHLVGCKKHEKIEKVTGSQDDGFVEGLEIKLSPGGLEKRTSAASKAVKRTNPLRHG